MSTPCCRGPLAVWRAKVLSTTMRIFSASATSLVQLVDYLAEGSQVDQLHRWVHGFPDRPRGNSSSPLLPATLAWSDRRSPYGFCNGAANWSASCACSHTKSGGPRFGRPWLLRPNAPLTAAMPVANVTAPHRPPPRPGFLPACRGLARPIGHKCKSERGGIPVWQIPRIPVPRGERKKDARWRNWIAAERRDGRSPTGRWRNFRESGGCAGDIVRAVFWECVRLALLAPGCCAEPARGEAPRRTGERSWQYFNHSPTNTRSRFWRVSACDTKKLRFLFDNAGSSLYKYTVE